MKNKPLQKLFSLATFIVVTTTLLAGCGQTNTTNDAAPSSPSVSAPTPIVGVSRTENENQEASSSAGQIRTENENQEASSSVAQTSTAIELYVQFGDDGAPFTMHLYDNETAAAIARHVGTADWRIPIYNYEGYDNWEVMQYYDIPSRYEIPSSPESVATHKAGAVYYSDPNRIVLFYGDAQVSGEYTPVGYFDATEEFVNAVESNPVLDGWSNKIIHISAE